MRRINLSLLTLFLVMVNVSMAFAQDEKSDANKFTISAQIRTRGEYRNGTLYPRNEGDDPAGFINERATHSRTDCFTLK